MTVAELIATLQRMPQHLPVAVNDEGSGIFHEEIGFVFHHNSQEDMDNACVILCVNET